MSTPTENTASFPELDRGIDRFLRADGWRVTDVTRTGSGVEVTMTKTTEPHMGVSVTRTAPGAGEATLKACSSARKLMSVDVPAL